MACDIPSLTRLAMGVGFDLANAQAIATVMAGESHCDPQVPCACAHVEGGTVYHGADCTTMGLDLHCGFLQWSKEKFPQLYSSPGCLGDAACELTAAYQVTGGNVLSAPSPWGPYFSQAYGGNGTIGSLPGGSGMAAPTLLSSGGKPPCFDAAGFPVGIPWVTCDPGLGAGPPQSAGQAARGLAATLGLGSGFIEKIGIFLFALVLVGIGIYVLATEGRGDAATIPA